MVHAQDRTIHHRSRGPRVGHDGLRRYAAAVRQRRAGCERREPRGICRRERGARVRGAVNGRGPPGRRPGARTAHLRRQRRRCPASASSTRAPARTPASMPTSAARSPRPCSAIRRGRVPRRSAPTSEVPALQTGEIDVLIRNTTWTVSRDTRWGLFAPTTFYDGQAIMVPTLTDATTLDDLAGATICVQSGTTTELNLTDRCAATASTPAGLRGDRPDLRGLRGGPMRRGHERPFAAGRADARRSPTRPTTSSSTR